MTARGRYYTFWAYETELYWRGLDPATTLYGQIWFKNVTSIDGCSTFVIADPCHREFFFLPAIMDRKKKFCIKGLFALVRRIHWHYFHPDVFLGTGVMRKIDFFLKYRLHEDRYRSHDFFWYSFVGQEVGNVAMFLFTDYMRNVENVTDSEHLNRCLFFCLI
jgi:hypothetical protein